jgi:hypothetical protein
VINHNIHAKYFETHIIFVAIRLARFVMMSQNRLCGCQSPNKQNFHLPIKKKTWSKMGCTSTPFLVMVSKTLVRDRL